jgi:hypothetical protein
MTDDRPPLTPDRAALVERAAQWLVDQPPTHRPIPAMKEQFGELTTAEACAAIGRANKMRACRAAFA